MKAAPSSEHSKLALCSFEEKLKVAPVLAVVAAGPPAPMIVFGALVSIVQWYPAAVPTLPAGSIARTRKSCAPAASAVYCLGEEQDANAAPSSEHSNVEPCSLAENSKLGAALDELAAGLESSVASGHVCENVQ